MRYTNDKSKLPNADEVKEILLGALKRMPVVHLMPFDQRVEDASKFIVTRTNSGRYSLKPNITQQGLLFRGENCKCIDSIPSLFRDGREGIMKHNVRRVDFERILRSFPLYEMLRKGVDLDRKFTLKIENPYGLAHSYGYASLFASLTADLDTAIFFAVTNYDDETQTFSPITDEDAIGTLYSIELRMPFGYMPGLSTNGMQVFLRPGLSREFLFQLPFDGSLYKYPFVAAFEFRQSAAISQRIFEQFHRGIDLFPDDDILAKKIASFPKNIVSEIAFKRNLQANPSDNESKNKERLEKGGYKISTDFNPCFKSEELQPFYKNVKVYWEQFCNQLIFQKQDNYYHELLKDLPNNPVYAQYFQPNPIIDEE